MSRFWHGEIVEGARARQRARPRDSDFASGPGGQIRRLLELRPQLDTASRQPPAGKTPDLRTGGLQVDSGAAQLLKVRGPSPNELFQASTRPQLQAKLTLPKFVLAANVC